MAVDLLDRVEGPFRWRVVATERTDGDMHPAHVSAEVLRGRQQAITGCSWTMVDQVHGRDVHVVAADDGWPIAAVADVIVSEPGEHPLALWAADCAPIVLFGRSGRVVGAHAGWRGLAGGVIDAAVAAIVDAGDIVVAAVVGPLIHPGCYEFATADLQRVADGVHAVAESITAQTTGGGVALDAPAAVKAGLAAHGIDVEVVGACTGCSSQWFSHRSRADSERHALVAWAEHVAQ